MTTTWLALCCDCTPALPMPFDDMDQRDQWADQHSTATGHLVAPGFGVTR